MQGAATVPGLEMHREQGRGLWRSPGTASPIGGADTGDAPPQRALGATVGWGQQRSPEQPSVGWG